MSCDPDDLLRAEVEAVFSLLDSDGQQDAEQRSAAVEVDDDSDDRQDRSGSRPDFLNEYQRAVAFARALTSGDADGAAAVYVSTSHLPCALSFLLSGAVARLSRLAQVPAGEVWSEMLATVEMNLAQVESDLPSGDGPHDSGAEEGDGDGRSGGQPDRTQPDGEQPGG